MALVASGGPCGVPGIQAGSSPLVTQVRRGLGGENGYVRARRTRVAMWETAPTVLVAGAEVVGWSSLACLGGGISGAPCPFLQGPLRV